MLFAVLGFGIEMCDVRLYVPACLAAAGVVVFVERRGLKRLLLL